MEKEIKVAMLLYTQGLEYDDRIRKEILTIQKEFPNVKFKIFPIVPENKERSGVTDYGVPFYTPYLKSRDKYASGSHTLYKAYEFYKTLKPEVKKFDIVWCADVETFMFPLLLPVTTTLVWDQHEIPSRFAGNFIMRYIFRYMEKKCCIMYHANQPRIDYLFKNGVISEKGKHVAIRNYPESGESYQSEPDDRFKMFEEWRKGRKCVYIQGISANDRKGYETLSAVLRTPDLCGVVVGSVDKGELQKIKDIYSEEIIKERIFFTGRIPQRMTKLYISECILALVFYATDTANNIYCEPNRMFQSVMMGIPVVVGCNPSMKDVVEQYKVGIALDNDGSDLKSIEVAINKIIQNYDTYKMNVLNNRDKLCWDHQENIIRESFEKVLNKLSKHKLL